MDRRGARAEPRLRDQGEPPGPGGRRSKGRETAPRRVGSDARARGCRTRLRTLGRRRRRAPALPGLRHRRAARRWRLLGLRAEARRHGAERRQLRGGGLPVRPEFRSQARPNVHLDGVCLRPTVRARGLLARNGAPLLPVRPLHVSRAGKRAPNPRTGGAVHVSGKRLPLFKVGRELSGMVSGGGENSVAVLLP